MRILKFDQFEFEDPSAEQCLIVARAHKGLFEDIWQFAAATSDLPEFVNRHFAKSGNQVFFQTFSAVVSDHLCRFGIATPNANDKGFVLVDEWNEMELIFESQFHFYRYVWTTTS